MIRTTFIILVVILAGCQNQSTSNSNAVGRYVQWQGGKPFDQVPYLLDTEKGVVYMVPNERYMLGAVEALHGRIVPDSSMAHWIPIIQFKE